MSADLADLFQLQLASQAVLHDLTFISGRKKSAERVAAFFLRMQDLLPITTTLEIGAHEATFSRNAKRRHPERTARAYEANPHVHAHFMLEGSVRKEGVCYEHYAIGDTDGSASFHIYDKLEGRAEPCDSRRQSVLPRVESADSSCTTVQTPLARLDSLCAMDAEDSRYALWIDAEGFSAQVLAGAAKILSKTLAVYIELESSPKFAGQSCDREIMATLLEQDFVPILRDFQFRHQYNVIFVKKECLPLVEHEWHRYFQAVLRQDLQGSFKLEVLPKHHTPVAPPPLQHLKFDSVRELREAMNDLPLLRAPRTEIDPERVVVACHASDLEEAAAFYGQRLKRLPAFHVLNLPSALPPGLPKNIVVHDFADLAPGMDIQLYFKRAKAPRLCWFTELTLWLSTKGIMTFGVEKYSTELFYRRNKKENLTDKDWDTVLNFVNALCDADSQYVYMAVCRSRLEAEPGYIPMAGYEQYFHPQVSVKPDDIVCEGGIDDGKSTLRFFEAMNRQGKIYAFEPVPASCEKLRAMFAPCEGICLEHQALWKSTGHILLSGTEASNAAFTVDACEGQDNCPCTSIDDYFSTRQHPTVIKLDVEGAEPEVLEGAQKILAAHSPKLMLSIYHSRRGQDWITIPRMLLRYADQYTLFCGHHGPWYAETVIYAN